MKKKLAIVLSGGGMTCSYTAGYLGALAKEHGFTNPDIVLAGSGSAGTASYFVARQYDDVTSIWSDLLSTKDFIDPLRVERIIDIDYLIDTVFKKEKPLQEENIHRSVIKFFIAATNSVTGKVEYFSNKDELDWFEVMRATKALPIVFNKCIEINGKTYCDSLLSSYEGLNILKAAQMGATHILVISTDSQHKLFEAIGYDLWLDTRGKTFRTNQQKLERKIAKIKLPKRISLFMAVPEEKLAVGSLDNNQDDLRAAIQAGYTECKNSEGLRAFLGSL